MCTLFTTESIVSVVQVVCVPNDMIIHSFKTVLGEAISKLYNRDVNCRIYFQSRYDLGKNDFVYMKTLNIARDGIKRLYVKLAT